MKRYFIAILIMCLVFSVHAISSYKASYDLYVKTDLGNINLGTAEFDLIVSNNTYLFTSNAKTNMMWSALYDYSVDEMSIGLIKDNALISDYYKISENEGNLTSNNYEIQMHPNEGYVSLNNEALVNGFTKSSLKELSDSELIKNAIGSGNRDEIKFTGSQALDHDVPSYEKDLANREELIEALLKPLLDVDSVDIVDALSVYLHISNDIQKNPNKKVFIYQVVDKKGITQREFIVKGFETISINNKDLETIKIICPEFGLIFNISKDHNFMPVMLKKINGKTHYQLILRDFLG